jgi:hypothetical protein
MAQQHAADAKPRIVDHGKGDFTAASSRTTQGPPPTITARLSSSTVATKAT